MERSVSRGTDRENKMGVQPVGRLLAGMAVPMMISMLVQALYNIVDSIFVSRLSENALTAVSLAFPLQNLMIAVCAGTTVGMNALLSRSLGAKEQDKADQAANTGIFLGLASFAVFCVLGLTLSHTFFRLQTVVAEIVTAGTVYGQICLGASVGLFCQFTFERLLQSTGRTHLSMCTQLLGALLNILLDPILIFGLFGFPRLGVAGAALATVIGQCVAATAALIMNLKCNPEIHLSLRRVRWHSATAKHIYRIGLPSIVMQCIGSIMVFGVNKILLSFTTTATAVFGAYFKLQSFIFMPVFGLNNGMVPIVAYNYGARQPARVKRTIKLAILSAMSIMAVGLALFELIPGPLLTLFDASENMLAIGIPALRIIALSFVLAGFCIISMSVCQAIGNPIYSLVVSVCRQLVVLLPVAWLLSRTGVLTLVWLAFPIAELMSLTLSAIFLRKTLRTAEAAMAKAP
ncbi:MAG: MATE family efflux transporter [Clostridiales bacterium]|nr:MATE family efflux transporter [Clostridiales bacterium]